MDYTDAVSSVIGDGTAAQASAVGSINDNPDEAARAIQLSDSSGVPAPVIYGDQSNFEQQHKAALAGSLIQNNPQLQTYVGSDPMAAKVSNDDYGQLDAVSQATEKLNILSPTKAMIQGFQEGFDYQGQRDDAQGLMNFVDSPIWRTAVRGAIGPAFGALDVTSHAFSGLVQGIAAGVKTDYQYLTGADETQANRLFRDLIVAAQVGLAGEGVNGANYGLHPEMVKGINEASAAVDKSMPYLAAGQEVPVGVHPLVDKSKATQADTDVGNLKDALTEAQASATKERAPDLFRNFIAQHVGEQEVGISADAVKELYGDKVPSADDGKLGFVPDIANQLLRSTVTGADIQVPTADLIAKMDPDVFKQLEDHIRVRPDGVTKEEAKGLSTPTDTEPMTPVDTVRQSAGLTVYHGTPHDFDKFDINKIGTGEGNQAFGHGLYFAENEDVAKGYQDKLAQQVPQLVIDGKKIIPTSSADVQAYNKWQDAGDIDEAISDAKSDIKISADPEASQKIVESLEAYKAKNASLVPEGHLLQVKINRPSEHFLDWDKPLSEQSAHVREAIENHPDPMVAGTAVKYGNDSPTMYDRISQRSGGSAAASQLLHENGIAGIKYKDGNSRWDKWHDKISEQIEQTQKTIEQIKATDQYPDEETRQADLKGNEDQIKALKEQLGDAKKPTRNYVVFNHNDLEITHKNGEPLTKAERAGVVAQLEQPEEAQTQLFKQAAAIGLTEKQYSAYMSLIDKRNAADFAKIQEKAKAIEERQQTSEWKTAEIDTRAQVSRELAQQPRHLADKLLRDKEMPPLDTDALTPEQRAGLPKEYYQRNGIDPDYAASQIGFESGDEMVQDLATLHAERKAAGVNSYGYMRKLVDDETARRMNLTHGDLSENILEAAKQQALSQTQLDLLHAETEGLAAKASVSFPMSKEQFRGAVKQNVGDMPIGQISSDKFLAAAGRAGRAVEDALLKGDAAEAFRQKQRQYKAITAAQEAMKIEKQKAAFDKLAKQYAKPEVTGALQEYTNQIQGVLTRLGQKVQPSEDFINQSTRKDDYKSFEDFVEKKQANLRDLHVPEFLLDPNFRMDIDKMPAEQFSQVQDALKAMAFHARNEKTVIRQGNKVDFETAQNALIDQIKSTFPENKRETNAQRGKFGQTVDAFVWSHVNLESMFDRIDRDNPNGPFSQILSRQFTQAAAFEPRMLKEYEARLRKEVGNMGDLSKIVPHDILHDPETSAKITMTNEMRLAMLQNAGNMDNLTKLAWGYGLEPETMRTWIENNTTPEEWQRAQKIGDMFKDLYESADNMSRNTSGVGIQAIPLEAFSNKHGTFDGWYNPISYDKIRGRDVAASADDLERPGFFRATTPQGYTKSRQRYIAPHELSFRMVPTRMRQMIHDIATREAVMQLSKFFYDDKFMQAMKDHYGVAQANELQPFLKDFAGAQNGPSQSAALLGSAVNKIGSNFVSMQVGLNTNTLLKHGGTAFVKSWAMHPVGFTQELGRMIAEIPTGSESWKMASEKSDEVDRRGENVGELMEGQGQSISLRSQGAAGKMDDLRKAVQHFGGAPLAFFDKLSSAALFNTEYRAAIAKGASEGDAVNIADKAVRQTHGSSLSTNRPSIVRVQNPVAKQFAKFYGFFSENVQSLYKASWLMKDALGLAQEGSYAEGLSKLQKGMLYAFTAGVLPAIIDTKVSEDAVDKANSWGHYLSKLVLSSVGSSFLGVREIMAAIVDHREVEGGPLGILNSFANVGKDLYPDKQGRVAVANPAKVGLFLRHSSDAIGTLTGVTNAQVGKSAEYTWNYFHNREHPNGPWQAYMGLRYGTQKGHSRSFDDWVKQELK